MIRTSRARSLTLLALGPLLVGTGGSPPWQAAYPVPAECVGGVPLAMRRVEISAQFNSSVTALAWSADGKRLASIGGMAGQIDVWDRDGQLLRQIKVGLGTYGALAFTPDGQHLVTSRSTPDRASDSIALDIWDLATGALVRRVPGPVPGGTILQNRSELVAFSADGSMAGSLAAGELGAPVQLYDPDTWAPIGTVAEPSPDIPETFALSPDGKHLALGTIKGLVILFDTLTQRKISSFRAYPGNVHTIAFSPDGTLVATGPLQGLSNPPLPNPRMIHIWRVTDGNKMRTYEGYFGPVRGLSWSPDGRFLASTSTDGPVRIWSTQRDEPPCMATDNFPPRAWPIAFSPDGAVLAAGGDKAIILFQLKL